MGDFNIDLLKSETCGFSHNFLLTLQSFSFVPTIDKPTRVYNNSVTLIDNIFVNRIDGKVSSGNIVSDISKVAFTPGRCNSIFGNEDLTFRMLALRIRF